LLPEIPAPLIVIVQAGVDERVVLIVTETSLSLMNLKSSTLMSPLYSTRAIPLIIFIDVNAHVIAADDRLAI